MPPFKTNRILENSLLNNYIEAMKDKTFAALINKVGITKKEAINNTTKLQNTVNELKNCQNCKCLAACKNQELGCVNYPAKYNNTLVFSYVACQYKKEQIKKEKEKMTSNKILEMASMKDIDITDKNRVKLIKWVTNFIKSYNPQISTKGLYLHGNFGCGKTYILQAMFNELKKMHYTTEVVYFPTLLRDLKGNFDSLGETVDYLCAVDLLLIDDIGAEKVTEWGRDEILGTILQERMNNMKTTFFTSNFNINELENHLSNKGVDIIKAGRIIERIKQLTIDMEMISENRRK